MKVTEMNFLDYLGIEERNLLTSMTNFREEVELFHKLDKVYQAPLSGLTVSEEEAIVPQLYLFVHFHLYFAFSCILRAHLSDALASARKGIDAALTAYKLILEPDKAKPYSDRDRYFLFIEANLQKEIQKDVAAYPLARELLKIHDLCSEYGSHADISSFFHRLETKEAVGDKKDKILVHYFQFPRNTEEYRFYCLLVLQAFFLIFRIFKVFFDKKLKIIDPDWEATLAYLASTLPRRRQAAHARSEGQA